MDVPVSAQDDEVDDLMRVFTFCMHAHWSQARRAHKRWRKSVPGTPYFVHPLWCATSILQEPALTAEVRLRGATALALHDVLEDTHAALPEAVSPEIVRLVEELTVRPPEGLCTVDHELAHLSGLSSEAALLKLYDKVSNVIAGPSDWMADRWPRYLELVRRLAPRVKAEFGELVIVRLAQDILEREESRGGTAPVPGPGARRR